MCLLHSLSPPIPLSTCFGTRHCHACPKITSALWKQTVDAFKFGVQWLHCCLLQPRAPKASYFAVNISTTLFTVNISETFLNKASQSSWMEISSNLNDKNHRSFSFSGDWEREIKMRGNLKQNLHIGLSEVQRVINWTPSYNTRTKHRARIALILHSAGLGFDTSCRSSGLNFLRSSPQSHQAHCWDGTFWSLNKILSSYPILPWANSITRTKQ